MELFFIMILVLNIDFIKFGVLFLYPADVI